MLGDARVLGLSASGEAEAMLIATSMIIESRAATIGLSSTNLSRGHVRRQTSAEQEGQNACCRCILGRGQIFSRDNAKATVLPFVCLVCFIASCLEEFEIPRLRR